MKYNNSFFLTMEVGFAEIDTTTSTTSTTSIGSNIFSSRIMENQAHVLKNDIKLKKRCRGKRKPKRKENRRRARPGKSRSGFLTIGAPFNNNEFLINQRDATVIRKRLSTTDLETASKEQHFISRSDQDITTGSESLIPTNCSSPHDTSSGTSENTSDYESLHSPSASSSSGSSIDEVEYPQDDSINHDEMFDIDFALQNFEADYSAHQWELKAQLMTLPRQQLESKCSLLMDQLKELEERIEKREVTHGMVRVQELELEVEALRKENRRLRRVAPTPE